MSFSEEYAKLRKKRLAEQEEKTDNSFSSQYAQLRKKRLEEENQRKEREAFASALQQDPAAVWGGILKTFSEAETEEEKRRIAMTTKSLLGENMPDPNSVRKVEDTSGVFKSSSLWDDGYQPIIDDIRVLGSTANDLGVSFLEGVSQPVEGITDLLLHGTAGLIDLFGGDEAADALRDWTNVNHVQKAAQWYRDFTGKGDESVLGDFSRNIGSGLGQLATMALTAGAGSAAGLSSSATSALTTGGMFASSMGSGIGEAYKGGATDGEAWGYGALQGAVEAGSELIFGGLGKGLKVLGAGKGLSSLDDQIARAITKNASNKFFKSLVQTGVKASAEGLEEVLAGIGTALAQKATYLSEEELGQLVNDQNLLDSFVTSAIISGIAQAGDIRNAQATGRDMITGLTENETKVIEKVFQQELAQKEKEGKVTGRAKSKLYDDVREKMEKGYISTRDIESTLAGKEYTEYRKTAEAESAAKSKLEALKKEYASFGDIKRSEMTRNQLKREKQLEAEIPKLQQQVSKMESASAQQRQALNEKMSKLLANDRLTESYAEERRTSEAFTADLSKYSEKQKKFVQKAIDSKVLNNTNRSHELVDLIAKIHEDKDVDFDFTNNKKLAESGFSLEGATINGFVGKNGITVNVNSQKALNSVVGHEITHVLEGSQMYDALKSVVETFARDKGEYDKRLEQLTKLYEGKEGYTGEDAKLKIEQEVVADLVGDYLFTDKDFVQSLSTQNRNVFQKIYDEVKYLCRVAVAGSKEARQLEQVKKTMAEVYRGTKAAQQDGVRYSLRKDIVDVNGKQYDSVVELDKTVSKSTLSNPKRLMKYIENNLVGLKIPVLDDGGNIEVIEFAGPKETTAKNGNPHPVLGELAYAKGDTRKQVIVNAKEVIEESVYDPQYSSSQSSHGWLDKNGWESRKTYVLAKDGNVYEAYLKIAKTKDGRNLLYSVNLDIKNGVAVDKGATQNRAAVLAATPSAEKIPQNESDVNHKYFDAVNRGDMETAQRMVDEAAKDAGYTNLFYHGSKKGGGFTEFRDWSYFTESKQYAQRYAERDNPDSLYQTYVKLEKPFDTRNEDARRIFAQIREEYGLSDIQDSGLPDWTDGYDIAEYIDENGLDYDGIILDEGGDLVNGEPVSRGLSYVIRKSAQIKSADPVTYDDKGNVIPLSERFNPEKNDIRYSLSEAEDIAPVGWKIRGEDVAMAEETAEEEWAPRQRKYPVRKKTAVEAPIAPLPETVKGPLPEGYQESVGAAPSGFDPVSHLQYEYGTLPEGENPVRDDSLPKSITGKDKVSLTARTAKGAEATPDELVDLLDKETVGGRFSYIPIKNSDTVQKAYDHITNVGWEVARGEWKTRVRNGEVNAELTATGALLLNNAAKAGDRKAWLEVLHDYQLMGTNAGQAVQAMRILKTLAPDDSLYMIERSVEQMVEDMKLGTEIVIDEDLKEAYLNAETDTDRDAARKALSQNIASQIPSTAADKWTALRYLNMLGNLRTQGRNILGNFGMSATSRIKNTVATALETLAEKASGGKFHRTKSFVVGGDLLKAAKNDFVNVESVALNGGKFNDPMAKSLEFQQQVQNDRKIFKFAPLEGYRRATNFAMDKGDLVFSRAAYGRALAGYLKANGITETDFSKINQQVLDEARAYAIKEAQEQTFRDNNWLSSWVSKMGRRSDTPKMGKLISEGIMPFRKTPANILLRAEEYSPLGLINAAVNSYRAARGSETVTGADAVNSWAKALTGTGLFALGMLLNNSGMLSGGPDDDEDKEWFEDQYGWQNYALHIGGKNFTIDFLSPAAMPLLMGAQLNEVRLEDGIQLSEIESVLTSIADPMIEMSMLQGVNDTLDNIRYAESNLGQFLINAGVSYLTQGLTNSFMGQIERSFDGQRMTTYVDKDSDLPAWLQKAIGKASAKIPGFDYKQIPYINAWGETEDIAPLPALMENALSPSYIEEGVSDFVYEELNRLNDAQSDINVYPQTPDKTVTFDDANGVRHEDYNLSKEEYVALAQLQGQVQKGLVEEILQNERYSGLNDQEKAKAVQLAYKYAREFSRMMVLNSDGFSSKWMAESHDIVDSIISHTSEEKTYEYDNPNKYALALTLGGYDAYKVYSAELSEIKADKKANGDTISGSRKKKVLQYLNDSDLSYGQKVLLYKSEYPSDTRYDQQIVEYIAGSDMTTAQKYQALEALGFKVDEDGNITSG